MNTIFRRFMSRGSYYKAKYGGGGSKHKGGGRGGGGRGGGGQQGEFSATQTGHRSFDRLINDFRRVDGQSYGAYKRFLGEWTLDDFEALPGLKLSFDRIQSDPFAPPSSVRVMLSTALGAYPQSTYSTRARRVALGDFLTRRFIAVQTAVENGDVDMLAGRRGGGFHANKGGQMKILRPSQAIFERSTCVVSSSGDVEMRIQVSLPARGRTVLGAAAANLFSSVVLPVATNALPYAAHDPEALSDHLRVNDDANALRDQLHSNGLVSFVADGSILARASGASDLPLPASEKPVPFQSPPSMRVTLKLSDGTEVSGMGVPPGVTLVIGGGFHGKSTLLNALTRGVYNHVRGDGRERVVTVHESMKVRAEDNRSVTGVDISAFIGRLPHVSTSDVTSNFSTGNASGSTSQAAAVCEAVELGARLLLIDEDEAATNFMFRDSLMARIVQAEPITSYVQRARALYESRDVSSLLIVGSSGAFFSIADKVLMMRDYSVSDVTVEARTLGVEAASAIHQLVPADDDGDESSGAHAIDSVGTRRTFEPRSLQNFASNKRKVDGTKILYGSDCIDLYRLPLFNVEVALVQGVMGALVRLSRGSQRTIVSAIEALENDIDANGIDVLNTREEPNGHIARPRRFEIGAALNRYRHLRASAHASAEPPVKRSKTNESD